MRLHLARCRGQLLAAVLLLMGHSLACAAEGGDEPRRGPSPDTTPACANPAPPPLTYAQMEAYTKPRTAGSAKPPLGPADEAKPIREGAMPKHLCFLEVAERGNIDLLFVGDSITDFFGRPDRGQPVWNKYYGHLDAANFGISGDTTQDVLWRLQNGELQGFAAKVVVVMIGTNNIGRNTGAEIAAGNAAIVQTIREAQPDAKILLLGIFPRGNSPSNPVRAEIRNINERLASLDDGESVFFLDIGTAFLGEDGTLRDAVFVDGTHPSIFGYAIWAGAIASRLSQLGIDPDPVP